jgi:hypothetical protein
LKNVPHLAGPNHGLFEQVTIQNDLGFVCVKGPCKRERNNAPKKIQSLPKQFASTHNNNKMAAAVPAPAFDAAALTLFWEDADSMSLSNHTCVQLAVKGITVPGELEEYDEAGLEKIFHNLAKPAKVATAQECLCEVEPFKVTGTGKAKQRLQGAAQLVKFYKTISRKPPLDPR